MPTARPRVCPLFLSSPVAWSRFLLMASLIPLAACQDGYEVLHQVAVGPAETNAYLLYDVRSREAALFDVAGAIDSLLAVVDEKELQVKYLFTTHAHQDHVWGMPEIRARFPQAQWAVSREEYEDTELYARWEEILSPEQIASMKQLPGGTEVLAFDFTRLGEPDIFLEDGQTYRLGDLEIDIFLTPGHTRGSICFHAGNALFSGDVLYAEAIPASVRHLFEALPEGTVILLRAR